MYKTLKAIKKVIEQYEDGLIPMGEAHNKVIVLSCELSMKMEKTSVLHYTKPEEVDLTA